MDQPSLDHVLLQLFVQRSGAQYYQAAIEVPPMNGQRPQHRFMVFLRHQAPGRYEDRPSFLLKPGVFGRLLAAGTKIGADDEP